MIDQSSGVRGRQNPIAGAEVKVHKMRAKKKKFDDWFSMVEKRGRIDVRGRV